MLSIIIPARNEEAYLPALLKSIREQHYEELEIIVADANSTDKTREIAHAYKCRIINGGLPAYGRNQGALQAEGNILLFVDSDIILPRNFLNQSLEEFHARKLDVAGTLQAPISTGNIYHDFRNKLIYGITNYCMMNAGSKRPFMQSCMFARKSIHNRIKGFDETLNYGEDSDYAEKAVEAGANFGILSEGGKVYISPRRFESKGTKFVFKNIGLALGMGVFGYKFRIKPGKKTYWDY